MIRSVAISAAAVICAALACADVAEAQYFGRNKVRYEHLDFRLLQTEHFDIYYYAEEEVATREAARMAERWYARFAQLLDHSFTRRQPLVLYASHPHFSQTNLTAGSPGEGTGGFTEQAKSRIAMPFAAGLGETDHVLGHEIAHAFQIDIAKSVRQNAFTLPGWLIEGMAEYLSVGAVNPNTAMWMRDAAEYGRLPTLKQLKEPRFFPYRFGHALWAYLGSEFGDDVLGRVLRSKKRDVIDRLEEVTGLTAEQIGAGWHSSVRSGDEGATPFPSRPLPLSDQARIHVGPALSPDGRRLMFLSERDRVSLGLFLTDTTRLRDARKLLSTTTDPHFDSLQYIHSAGAWDAEGRRFAITALSRGEPLLVILDTVTGTRTELPLPGVSETYNATWSPDGSRIAFSALKGGLSDLFVFTIATGAVEQLTADAYGDLHPAWSPDGRAIAFATDRFTTDLEQLRFGAMRIAVLDLASMRIEQRLPDASSAKQVNPQWSPDGSAIYFISDRQDVSNVYRLHSSGELRQVTRVPGGVSGITSTSPALAVASRAGTLAFSVYRNGRYEIATVSEEAARSAAVVSPPAPAVEHAAEHGTDHDEPQTRVVHMLADARSGLPSGDTFTTASYDDRLRLESMSQPYIGASTGGGFGGILRTSFGVTFNDTLRDRQLQTMFRLGTRVDDLAVQLAYMNRRGQWNWGITTGVMPSLFYAARRSIARDGDLISRDTSNLRYFHGWAGLAGRYNISRVQRLEVGAGVRRIGLDWQTTTRVTDVVQDRLVERRRFETPAGRALHLAETNAAFVHDTSVSGPTSPILGQRLRLQIDPAFGRLTFADVRVDARRYFMPYRPITIAARVQHIGRYGSGAADSRLTPLLLGLDGLVRGYDLESFAADECGHSATQCSVVEQLTGSRFALLNLEVRAPLRGLFTGEIDYGSVPVELVAFADGGFLWTGQSGSRAERDRFRSVGAGARVNVGGIVFEMTASRPFDRPDGGWLLNVLLRPGW